MASMSDEIILLAGAVAADVKALQTAQVATQAALDTINTDMGDIGAALDAINGV